jgi:hypothetical protein
VNADGTVALDNNLQGSGNLSNNPQALLDGAAKAEDHVTKAKTMTKAKAAYQEVHGICCGPNANSDYPNDEEDSVERNKGETEMKNACNMIPQCKGFQMNDNGWRGLLIGSTTPVACSRPSGGKCYIRTDSEAASDYTDVGEGFCQDFKELTSGGTIANCFAQANADNVCANKDAISYGKGSRAKRCLCDITTNCELTGGIDLGDDGYDRFEKAFQWLDLASFSVSQSSTSSSEGDASHAVDGNMDTQYSGRSCTHTALESEAWWEVDLGSVMFVQAVEVTNRGDCCGERLNGFSVLVDGVACASNQQITQGQTKEVMCDNFLTRAVGRVVRVKVNDNFLTLCEVRIAATQAASGSYKCHSTEHYRCANQAEARFGCNYLGLRLCRKDEIASQVGPVCAYMWTESSTTNGYYLGKGTSGCGQAGVLNSSTLSNNGEGMFDAACCEVACSTFTTQSACPSRCAWTGSVCEEVAEDSTITSTITPTTTEACVGFSEQACRNAAIDAGLQAGGDGYAFAGDYVGTGCYAYSSGQYAGMAYYGYADGGGDVQSPAQLTDLSDTAKYFGVAYRPPGTDCEALWPQVGGDHSKCSEHWASIVASQAACQLVASHAGHSYYQFRADTNMCGTYATCDSPITTGTHQPWKIYQQAAANGTCYDLDPSTEGGLAYACPSGYFAKIPAVPDGLCTDVTTCNANCCEALWPQVGENNSKCSTIGESNSNIDVASQAACQLEASQAGHSYYQFDANNNLCATYAACDSLINGTNDPWKIYQQDCGPNCANCESGICTRCNNGMYLDSFGSCDSECPDGYIKSGDSDEGNTCQVCQGEARRRRADTCDLCAKGFLPQTAKDTCINIQDLCTPESCQTCLGCLEPLRDEVKNCPAVASASCYHPGHMWCGHFIQELNGCEGFSYPCFYFLLCKHDLVCSDWKAEFCGGQTSLIEGSNSAKAEDWIPESFGLNNSYGSATQQMAVELSRRLNRFVAYDMHLSKTNEEVDVDVDGLSGLDAAVKGKCVG